eukprot:2831977-Pyramimonas_sp.AAC.1
MISWHRGPPEIWTTSPEWGFTPSCSLTVPEPGEGPRGGRTLSKQPPCDERRRIRRMRRRRRSE